MNTIKRFLFTSMLSIGAASVMQGAVISSWINDTTEDPFPMAATSAAPSITSATADRGPGTNAFTFTGSQNGLLAIGMNQSTVADAISDGDYISFSFDLGSSFWDFDSIMAYTKSQSTTADAYLFSSETGGFVDGEQIGMFEPTTSPNGAAGDLWNVDLSSVSELQTVTGTVEFRFYFVGDTGFSHQGFRGPNDMSDDDIYFQGTEVPEPSTYAALAGLAALGIALYRRRS